MDTPARKIKILLAEDEPTISMAYKIGLTHHGYEVIITEDGKEALNALKEHRTDILLLDLIMPHMTGLEVLAAIRQDSDLQTLPVIMLSNMDQPADVARAYELGAKAYLVKANLSLRELIEHINMAVSEPRRA